MGWPQTTAEKQESDSLQSECRSEVDLILLQLEKLGLDASDVRKDLPDSKSCDMHRLKGRFSRSFRYGDTPNSPVSNSARCTSLMSS